MIGNAGADQEWRIALSRKAKAGPEYGEQSRTMEPILHNKSEILEIKVTWIQPVLYVK